MKIINNKQGDTLIAELEKHIEKDAVVSIGTSLFSVYALYELRERFKDIKELNLYILANNHTRMSEGVGVTPNEYGTSEIWGTDEEKELKRRLLLRRVSLECSELIKKKGKIRQTVAPGNLAMKLIFVMNPSSNDEVILMNMSDFTASSLGVIQSKSPQNHIVQNEYEMIQIYFPLFKQDWNNGGISINTKQEVLAELEKGYRDYTPKFLYYYILHHLFHYSIVDFADDKIIKHKTGFKEKKIWNKLYNFQQDGVIGAIEKIEKYGGCIIADSVGLGKTFEALAVIKYYELRNDRVLVLCPKKLRDNWTVYTLNDTRNILLEDRFNYDVLNHSDLTRVKGFSGDINLGSVNWSNYDLVVIDESHNFRNNNPAQEGMTRYARLMHEVIKKGVTTKILMLSATPVNNRMNDLKNQIAFITQGEDSSFINEGIDNINIVMKQAQAQFTRWAKNSNHNIKSLFEYLDNRYFKLLDMLTIARSRKHIIKYYDEKNLGKFPFRLPPINEKTDIDNEHQFPSLKEINNAIRKINLANYSPMSYIQGNKIHEYEKKYDYKLKSGSVFKQIDREKSLINLMRVNYLKRMESSIHSFYISIKKLIGHIEATLNKIEHAHELINESISIEDVDVENDTDASLIGNTVKVLLQDIDLVRWKQALEYDRNVLTKILESAKTVTAERDAKLSSLKHLITNKISHPINGNNKKIIIFSAFADTTDYLYAEISQWVFNNYGLYSCLIKGSGTNKTNFPGIKSHDINELLTHFSPNSKERSKTYPNSEGEIDILIATDCISEGQNLQDCDYLINYDIHWNPVRIIQRFGRIDRIGSTNEKIQLVNFWPNMELNEYINLENRVRGKMVLLDVSATGEENLIETQPNDEMIDLEYRSKQLKQIQDAVIDLEDIQGGITITDLNMNDFRMDILEYEKDHLEELMTTPKGIHTVVNTNDDDIQPGTVFCLKSNTKIKGKSLLSPYYLVYMSEDGQVLLGYLMGRYCLDYLNKLCQGQVQVLKTLTDQVKNETKNYRNMSKYSSLLHLAIENVIGKSQEVGAASFFSGDLISLDAEGVNSQSDFDIVAYVIIKK